METHGGINVLMRRYQKTCCLSFCPLPCDNILRRLLGRELSLDLDHAGTLISDVQASGT